MSRTQYQVFAIAVALGYLYIALLLFKPYPLSWLLKPLPMLLFAWLVWSRPGGTAGGWLALGFAGAAAGDFFLDYGNRDGLFMQALLAFLVTQVAFLVAFLLLGRGRPVRWAWCLPVLLYTGVMIVWMLPGTGDLRLPVLAYFIVLLAMAMAAARVEAQPGTLYAGAVLFLVADSLIGVNKFIQPFPFAVPVIVSVYFTGQVLIALGLLRCSASPATTTGAVTATG
ncbi:lysoplasmalogenase [Pseudomonas sp. GD03944]|uniref:lysoplasmalogenase n=1 Tax=Pseudomonas sp. GD03944 TaxID=2975409 RepID=UPI0024481022|nr:lysoplasmalogenase [Pseudomonas sp. GD03944]MDH1262968.1 lysoplasmalogenase [Pseudomonas sp. GD03944]